MFNLKLVAAVVALSLTGFSAAYADGIQPYEQYNKVNLGCVNTFNCGGAAVQPYNRYQQTTSCANAFNCGGANTQPYNRYKQVVITCANKFLCGSR